jgi:hypothetical protein
MTAILERPLYGKVLVETAPWASPFVWTDQTANLVSGLNYSQGGRLGTPGASQSDVGTLNATFKSLSTVPIVGALIRISFSDVAGYAFVGYVQDVSQRIVFDNTVKLSTPVVLTTLNCVDWVGYISQFQTSGIGGVNDSSGATDTSSAYQWTRRVAALNKVIDSSFNTKLILSTGSGGSGPFIGDTDYVGTIGEHLDLIAPQSNVIWFGKNTIPTNVTTGRTSLVEVSTISALTSSGKTFTDVAGSSGQLHYTEIDFQNTTANVANTILVQNRNRINVTASEITRIGGFNDNNYMIINNQNIVGISADKTWNQTDSTSITTYGVRQTEIQTNIATTPSTSSAFNLIINPSIEYSDDGWVRGNTNCVVRRRKPSEDANPFDAYTGLWAMRSRQTTASPNARILFTGGESDGIPVVAGTTYYWKGYAARGTTSRTDMRALLRVYWYDETETQLSITTPSTTALTTANTWYLISGSGAAPANAVRATIEMLFERSGGGNVTVGDYLWADAWLLTKGSSETYFDGDTPWTTSSGYVWSGGVGASPSYRVTNYLDNVAVSMLAQYSTTSMAVTRIRWNAQEQLTAVPLLSVGKTISLTYSATTTTYRIVGIDGTVNPDRYMIDYYLAKV